LPDQLSDNQIGDRLYAALEIIGDAVGETKRGNTTLDAARKALGFLQAGLLYAAEKKSDQNDAIQDNTKPPAP